MLNSKPKTLAMLLVGIFYLNILSAQTNFMAIDTTLVLIKEASFQMGNTKGKSDERPVHTVRLNAFYISKYELTQKIWRLVMESDTLSKSDGPDFPVYDVKPENIDLFISKLNQLTGKKYRLPTEAEWEYAATGGSFSKAYKYCGSDSLNEVAWYAPNASMKTHQVGLKKPNELGLYDMSGNVWEICSDWYQRNFYKKSPVENPLQAKKTLYRLVRGGSWRSEEQRCQSHARNIDVHDHHIGNSGFRLVLEVK